MSLPVELHVTVLNEHVDAVTDALWARGPSAIEERPLGDSQTTLVAGFADREAADAVAAALTASGWCRPERLTVSEFTDESWLDQWRGHARSVRVGRFLVVPSWLAALRPIPMVRSRATPCASGSMPARAFGSGSHPTTRLMLGAVEQLVSAGTAVLDVGCGSGVLAIAAAELGGSPVVAIDVDPAAEAATRRQCRRERPRRSCVGIARPAVFGRRRVRRRAGQSPRLDDRGAGHRARPAHRPRRPPRPFGPPGRSMGGVASLAFPAGPCRRSPRRTAGLRSRSHERRDDGVTTSSRPRSLRCSAVKAPRLGRSLLAARTSDIEPFRVVEVMERAWALERSGRSVIRLCVGEPDFGTPAPVVEAARRSLSGGDVHYTSSLGLPPLREAISGYYAERFGLDVPARRIVITTGASGALLLATAATIDRDDEILLADPGYPCNRHFVRTFEGRAAPVPVGPETAYQLTAELVDHHWSDTDRVACSPRRRRIPPARPSRRRSWRTSSPWSEARNGVAYVDEIYGELVFDDPASTALSASDDVFVVNSCSKTFGMTGWRVGWLVCPEWALDAVEALAQNLYIAPPTPSQWAARAAFSPDIWEIVADRRAQFRARRDLLVDGLMTLGFRRAGAADRRVLCVRGLLGAGDRLERARHAPARRSRRRRDPRQRLRPPSSGRACPLLHHPATRSIERSARAHGPAVLARLTFD